MSARRRVIVGAALGLAALSYAMTGWVVVAPGEVAVVRRLGRVVRPAWGPGAHLGWPLGFDRVTRVRTDEVRRLAVGLADVPGAGDEPGAGEFLTGDLNLVRVRMVVQYRVDDPSAFALRAEAVEPLLSRLAEAGLSRAVARLDVDATLHDGRAVVAIATGQEIDRSARAYGLGVTVLAVSLTDVRPPSEVAAEFAAAQSARSARDRRVNEATTAAATTVTAARARAKARVEQSRARADRTLALARSRAARFLALLAEADKARALTVRRLYLDAVRDLLPRVRRKIVLTPDEPLDLSIMGDRGDE